MANLIAPLGDGLCQAHKIDLLKGVGAEGGDGHLPGNNHDGCGVDHRVGHAREGVGGAGSAGDDGHTHLSADACKALGGVRGALFVAHEDMVESFLLAPRIIVEGIIDGHDAAAGIAEDGLHSLGFQRQHQCLAACNLLFHVSCVHLFEVLLVGLWVQK